MLICNRLRVYSAMCLPWMQKAQKILATMCKVKIGHLG